MPKNIVSDPITDQEIAFAHLVLSGTMNDRRAAEAVGLNPDTAAYTKSKPRVHSYMSEHRAAVREKLVDLGRDRILTRLWELAALSSEATRGSIAGQMKALSMIAAIEGLIPSGMNARRPSPSVTQPVASPHKQSAAPAASSPTEPVVPRVPDPPFAPPLAHHAGTLNPFVIPQPLNRVPAPTTSFFDVALDAINSVNLPYSANLPRSL